LVFYRLDKHAHILFVYRFLTVDKARKENALVFRFCIPDRWGVHSLRRLFLGVTACFSIDWVCGNLLLALRSRLPFSLILLLDWCCRLGASLHTDSASINCSRIKNTAPATRASSTAPLGAILGAVGLKFGTIILIIVLVKGGSMDLRKKCERNIFCSLGLMWPKWPVKLWTCNVFCSLGLRCDQNDHETVWARIFELATVKIANTVRVLATIWKQKRSSNERGYLWDSVLVVPLTPTGESEREEQGECGKETKPDPDCSYSYYL